MKERAYGSESRTIGAGRTTPGNPKPSRARALKVESLHPGAFGVSLFIMVAVGRLGEVVPFLGGLPLAKAALLFGFIGVLMASGQRNRPVLSYPLGKGMLLFGMIGAFSVLVSVWKSHSLEFFIGTFVGNLLLFFLLVKTSDNDKTRRLYIGSLIASATLLIVPAFEAAGGGGYSTAYDPNDLAAVLVTILPLIIASSFTRRRLLRFGVALVVAAAVVATGSRSGFLGLVAVGGYLILTPTRGETTRAKRVLGVSAATAVLLLAVGGSVNERIFSITHLENDYNFQAETGRLAIWERGVRIMAHRPWGAGLNGFEAAEGMEGGRYKAAHNFLIQVGVELGIAGLIVFLALYLKAFRGLGRYHGSKDAGLAVGIRASLLGYAVTGFFLSQAYNPLLYVVLGLAAGLEPRSRAQKRTSNNGIGTSAHAARIGTGIGSGVRG